MGFYRILSLEIAIIFINSTTIFMRKSFKLFIWATKRERNVYSLSSKFLCKEQHFNPYCRRLCSVCLCWVFVLNVCVCVLRRTHKNDKENEQIRHIDNTWEQSFSILWTQIILHTYLCSTLSNCFVLCVYPSAQFGVCSLPIYMCKIKFVLKPVRM